MLFHLVNRMVTVTFVRLFFKLTTSAEKFNLQVLNLIRLVSSHRRDWNQLGLSSSNKKNKVLRKNSCVWSFALPPKSLNFSLASIHMWYIGTNSFHMLRPELIICRNNTTSLRCQIHGDLIKITLL